MDTVRNFRKGALKNGVGLLSWALQWTSTDSFEVQTFLREQLSKSKVPAGVNCLTLYQFLTSLLDVWSNIASCGKGLAQPGARHRKNKILTPCQAHNHWSTPVLQKCSRPMSARTRPVLWQRLGAARRTTQPNAAQSRREFTLHWVHRQWACGNKGLVLPSLEHFHKAKSSPSLPMCGSGRCQADREHSHGLAGESTSLRSRNARLGHARAS